jgi:hypothetical protein
MLISSGPDVAQLQFYQQNHIRRWQQHTLNFFTVGFTPLASKNCKCNGTKAAQKMLLKLILSCHTTAKVSKVVCQAICKCFSTLFVFAFCRLFSAIFNSKVSNTLSPK